MNFRSTQIGGSEGTTTLFEQRDNNEYGRDVSVQSDLCSVGEHQSPINLPGDVPIALFGDIQFQAYQNTYDATLQIKNSKLELVFNSDTNIVVSRGGLQYSYRLDRIQFRWESEHTLRGLRYAVEAQLIHVNTQYTAYDSAVLREDGLAIFSVLFHVGTEPNAGIKYLVEKAEEATGKEGASIAVQFSPATLIPQDSCAFYRYRGSLTDSPCSEVVTWTVFTDSLPITADLLNRLKSFTTSSGDKIKSNNRQLQNRDERIVLLQPLGLCKMSHDPSSNNSWYIFKPFDSYNN